MSMYANKKQVATELKGGKQKREGGKTFFNCSVQFNTVEKGERKGGRQPERFSVLTSLGFLTSESGKSCVVVVVVETVRPEPLRSISPLLSTPRFSSSPSPDLLPPFLSLLLPEFCSNSQSDHLPPAPAREEEGNSTLSSLVVVVVGSPLALEVPSLSVKLSGAIQSHTQQHNYVMFLVTARLLLTPPG